MKKKIDVFEHMGEILSEKVVLQEVFLRRMANLRLIFHWMTVQKKFLDTVGQNQEEM